LQAFRGVPTPAKVIQTTHDPKTDGPRLVLGGRLPPHREDPDYRRPADHTPAGLLVGGPEGDEDNLGPHQYFTYCVISAATPENARLRQVRTEGRVQAEFIAAGLKEPTMVTNGGRFWRPAKPANSGRKRKVA
jgi:hypothetical protein